MLRDKTINVRTITSGQKGQILDKNLHRSPDFHLFLIPAPKLFNFPPNFLRLQPLNKICHLVQLTLCHKNRHLNSWNYEMIMHRALNKRVFSLSCSGKWQAGEFPLSDLPRFEFDFKSPWKSWNGELNIILIVIPRYLVKRLIKAEQCFNHYLSYFAASVYFWVDGYLDLSFQALLSVV